ncbi:hypothetical protein IGI82_003660 [Enterococcus sp. AZ067]
MKFIRLATVAALSTTIFAGGVQAFAEETESQEVRQATTEGQITFTPSNDDTVVDPGDDGEDVTIPPITGPDGENKGPLTIATVPTMNFGSQIISTTDEHYNMVAERQQKNSNEGWALRVSLTEFQAPTNTLNNVLKGAKITLFEPTLRYSIDNNEQAPTIHASGLELIPNSDAVPIMTAANNKGAGTSTAVWGDHDAIAKQVADGAAVVENEAIQLFVPGSTAKDAVTYTSTLTWELGQTPDNEL